MNPTKAGVCGRMLRLVFGVCVMIVALPGATAAITYIGASLLIDALRADAGCEVMALPGLGARPFAT